MFALTSEYELDNGMRIFIQRTTQTQCLVKLNDKQGGQKSPLFIHELSFTHANDLANTVGNIMQFAYGNKHHDAKTWSKVWKALMKFAPATPVK